MATNLQKVIAAVTPGSDRRKDRNWSHIAFYTGTVGAGEPVKLDAVFRTQDRRVSLAASAQTHPVDWLAKK